MMKTKIGFFTLVFILATTLTFAQGGDSKISLGVLGGVNMQNLNGKNLAGNSLTNDMIIGFHAGVNVQIPIAPEFYFQPGLLFSTKGAKNEAEGTILGITNITTSTTKLSYIELPLNFVYKAQVGSGYVFLGFGPYVAYGIMGKNVVKSVTTGLGMNVEGEVESDIKFKNELEAGDVGAYVKPFDVGGNILFGYEMSMGVFIQLNAQLGMINIQPKYANADNDATVKNTGFGLSAGYRF